MEKLIELLNEYSVVLWDRYSGVTGEEYPKKWSYGITGPDNPGRYIFYSDNTNLSQTYLISKEYGFIKWLVDNDKIDLDKLKDNITFTAITHSIGIGRDWRTVKEGESIIKAIGTNAIIAYLSIQDNPIEFLISILK